MDSHKPEEITESDACGPDVAHSSNSCDSLDNAEVSPEKVKANLENEDDLGGPKFNPPLYRQRYQTIADVLQEKQVKSVADLGCAEVKSFMYYKNIPNIEKVIGVDLDRALLESHSYKVKPITTDYVMPRENPLHMALYAGDISVFDSRLAGIEALVLIEVIEHLPPSTLKALPHTIFGRLKPDLVIITTPNSDFNCLFPHFTGFRHWDHKFEWSREEFETWCNEVCATYNYSVEYSGIGAPPEGNEHLGHCSQMAIFTYTAADEKRETDEILSYSLVSESHHPHKVTRPREEQIEIETQYYLKLVSDSIRQEQSSHSSEGDEEPAENNHVCVPLERLLSFKKLADICNLDELRSCLIKLNYDLIDNDTAVKVPYKDYDSYHGYSDSSEDDDWAPAENHNVDWPKDNNSDTWSDTDNWEPPDARVSNSNHVTTADDDDWSAAVQKQDTNDGQFSDPEIDNDQQQSLKLGFINTYNLKIPDSSKPPPCVNKQTSCSGIAGAHAPHGVTQPAWDDVVLTNQHLYGLEHTLYKENLAYIKPALLCSPETFLGAPEDGQFSEDDEDDR